MNFQTKFMNEIKRIASDAGLDADTEFSWSNVGRVYFRKGFKTVANLSVDFQTDNATFAFNKSQVKAEYFTDCEKRFYVNYESEAEIMSVFNYLRKRLDAKERSDTVGA